MNKRPINGLPTRGPRRLLGMAAALAATAAGQQAADTAQEEAKDKADAGDAIKAMREVVVNARKVQHVNRMLAAYDAQIANMPEGHPLRQQAEVLVKGLRDAMAAAEKLA